MFRKPILKPFSPFITQPQKHHESDRNHRQVSTLFGEVVVRRLGYSSKDVGVSALYPGDG